MEFIMSNLETIVILLLAIVGLISFLLKKGGIQKLLVYICLEAERQFGSKTGSIKLRQVYDWFTSKYPIMSLIISFGWFSKMVDIALDEMEDKIKTNPAIAKYVGRI